MTDRRPAIEPANVTVPLVMLVTGDPTGRPTSTPQWPAYRPTGSKDRRIGPGLGPNTGHAAPMPTTTERTNAPMPSPRTAPHQSRYIRGVSETSPTSDQLSVRTPSRSNERHLGSRASRGNPLHLRPRLGLLPPRSSIQMPSQPKHRRTGGCVEPT